MFKVKLWSLYVRGKNLGAPTEYQAGSAESRSGLGGEENAFFFTKNRSIIPRSSSA
jgi:hypothetical protein